MADRRPVVATEEEGQQVKLGEPCAFCAEPGTALVPTYEYLEGYFAHDQCADEAGVPETEMV